MWYLWEWELMPLLDAWNQEIDLIRMVQVSCQFIICDLVN